MSNETLTKKIIVNQNFMLTIKPEEFRMCTWIFGFGLENSVTGEILIPLISSFNLDQWREKDDQLLLNFRIYPEGSFSYQVEINPFKKTFFFSGREDPLRDFFKTFTREE